MASRATSTISGCTVAAHTMATIYHLKILFAICVNIILVYTLVWAYSVKPTVIANRNHNNDNGAKHAVGLLQRHVTEQNLSSCEPKKNIVFLKTHKTGGTTFARIVERHAIKRKLHVVRKIGESSNLHFTNVNFDFDSRRRFLPPMGVKPGNYDEYRYNVFALHARYNRPVYESFMEKGSTYVTLLRDPVTQFESIFDYFAIGSDIFGSEEFKEMNKMQRLAAFLDKPSIYLDKLPHSKQKLVNNNQIWDLGVDPEQCDNGFLVDYSIQRLDNELDIVMLTEFFDESLLLLKKQLCWQFEDILYLPRNQRSERVSLSQGLSNKISQLNWIDTKLYSHFVGRLQERIKDYGPTFDADLNAFRNMTSFLYKTCVAGEKIEGKKGKVFYKPNSGTISGHGGLCRRVGSSDVCDFGTGYILSLDLTSLCNYETSIGSKLTNRVRNMMKENKTK